MQAALSEVFLEQIEETLLTDDQHLTEVFADALAVVVDDAARRQVDHGPALFPETHAQIEILEAHENVGIEEPRFGGSLSANHQAGPRNPSDTAPLPMGPAAQSKEGEHSVQ